MCSHICWSTLQLSAYYCWTNPIVLWDWKCYGSLLGGRWSDRTFRKSREKNHGITTPEVSVSYLKLLGLHAEYIVVLDAAEKYARNDGPSPNLRARICMDVPDEGPCCWTCCDALLRRVFRNVGSSLLAFRYLPVSGLTILTILRYRWIYSSTLTYIVDANTGRSSTAIASNSSLRGLAGFIAAEISAPLQVRHRPLLPFFERWVTRRD
jgi:hypothetical protein